MLKCALTSDTHRSFDHNTHRIHEKFLLRLAQENLDILIHAGDWASNKQTQIEKSMKMFRAALPKVVILTVFGNHDYWTQSGYGMDRIFAFHDTIVKENNIHYLGHAPYVTENTVFLGFDGWYEDICPPTNDQANFPAGLTHDYMARRAHNDLTKLLATDTKGKAVVGVTHFPSFTECETYRRYCASRHYQDPLTQKCNVLCVGHSHTGCDFMHGTCRVLNCGPDYNKPAYTVFEVP